MIINGKDYDRLISQFTVIKEQKVALVEEKKARHERLIETIVALKNEVLN